MSRKTLKLPENEYERHNEHRKELGLSWAEYIDGQSPEYETLGEGDVRRIVREEINSALRDVMASESI